MILKIGMSLLLSTFLAQTSQAVQIVCTGTYAGLYRFRASGELNSSHTRIHGNIYVTVVGAGSTRNAVLIPTSSDIREGSYIRGSGRTTDGKSSGELSAVYHSSSGLYHGSLHAQSSDHDVTVNVTCDFYQSLEVLK